MGLACGAELCDLNADETIERNDAMRVWINERCLYYGRYRDDVLVILNAREGRRRLAFAEAFNRCNPAYQATFEWHRSRVTFLDLDICKESANPSLVFRVHFKPTNLFRFLPFNSDHPFEVFESWIRAEINRYRSICSRNEDFIETVGIFKARLLKCGYSNKFLHRVFTKCMEDRERNNAAVQSRVVAFVLPHSLFWRSVGLKSLIHDLRLGLTGLLPADTRILPAFRTRLPLLQQHRICCEPVFV